ncbi:hypothetical protein ABPG77_009035 [Micractinium sp. CCAP 211/92]
MGPEQRRDLEQGLPGAQPKPVDGPAGYYSLPESPAPQERLLRSESRHSLSRSASRDQLPHQGHAQRIAAEVQEEEQELCYHKHHSNRSPWLRALVLGANDGLVSTAALMMGVGGGTADLATLRLAGVAGMVGGALSMAVGEYISVSSQRDAERADIEQERLEQLKGPAAQARELEELAQIYVERGLPYDLARQVAVVLSEKDVIRAHARDELGIDIDELSNPLQAAVVSAICFTVGAAIPLLSAAWIPGSSLRLGILAGATTVGLCLFGFLGAWLGGANVLRGGLRVIVGGWLALGIVYGIGRALNVDSTG